MPGKDREDRIRARAHELWLAEGQPEGQGDRHWLQAAAEIDAGKPAKKAASKKAAAKPKAAKPAAAKPAAAKAKPAPAKKAAPKKA